MFRITYYALKRNTKTKWHILRHLTHSFGDMAMICYILIGDQSLTNLMGTIKNQICIPMLGLVHRIRVGRGSGVTLLLRHNTEAYIVTTTTVLHPLLIPTIAYVEPPLLEPILIQTEHNQRIYRC